MLPNCLLLVCVHSYIDTCYINAIDLNIYKIKVTIAITNLIFMYVVVYFLLIYVSTLVVNMKAKGRVVRVYVVTVNLKALLY